MLFNKDLTSKEGDKDKENNNNKELTEQDYIQINKDITKALFEMKKEKEKEKDSENNSNENSEENEKELINFDMDFFSESSNSVSIDNMSDYSDNSINSEIVRHNLSLESNKTKNSNNEKNEINEDKKNLSKNKIYSNTDIRHSGNGKKIIINKKKLSFNSMKNERKNSGINSNGDNLNNSFNSSPYTNFNNNIFRNNYLNKQVYLNNNEINRNKNQNNNFNLNNVHRNNFINNNKNNNINNIINNNINNNINNLNFQDNIPPIMNNINNIGNINNINFIDNQNGNKIFLPNNVNNSCINNNNNDNNFINNSKIFNNINNNRTFNNCININNINQNLNILMMNNNNNILNNMNNNMNNNNIFNCSMSEGCAPNLRMNKDNVDSPKNIIHIENILKSKDKRTTLIIRNIPNRYTIYLLLNELNKNYYRKYDVVYLPQDYINNSNLGFGFINFLEHMYLIMFYEEFVGKKWNCFNSNKRCQLAYSKYQGKNELIKYIHKKLGISSHYNNNENLKKSFFINSDDKYPRPLIEIPIKYYKSFICYYPYSLCHIKDEQVFVVDKYYNF